LLAAGMILMRQDQIEITLKKKAPSSL